MVKTLVASFKSGHTTKENMKKELEAIGVDYSKYEPKYEKIEKKLKWKQRQNIKKFKQRDEEIAKRKSKRKTLINKILLQRNIKFQQRRDNVIRRKKQKDFKIEKTREKMKQKYEKIDMFKKTTKEMTLARVLRSEKLRQEAIREKAKHKFVRHSTPAPGEYDTWDAYKYTSTAGIKPKGDGVMFFT